MPREQWRPVPGYKGKYSVSSIGNVRREKGYLRRKRTLMKLEHHSTGYHRVQLWHKDVGRHFLVHRLVLMAFRGSDPKRNITNHINGKYDDNRLENLEWCTHSENEFHKYRVLGWHTQQGEKHSNAILKNEQVIEMRRLRTTGLLYREIAVLFGIRKEHVGSIVRRELWPHI